MVRACDCRDDQIILNGLFFYVGYLLIPSARHLPAWRADGAAAMALLHAGPVEFLYYWFHRALHHHFLYSRYHSHHHSSIVTEPITCKCCLRASPSRLLFHVYVSCIHVGCLKPYKTGFNPNLYFILARFRMPTA